jgi:hypothetical protein
VIKAIQVWHKSNNIAAGKLTRKVHLGVDVIHENDWAYYVVYRRCMPTFRFTYTNYI